MSRLATLNGRIVLRDGDDFRTKTLTISEQAISEEVWHQIALTSHFTSQISLGGTTGSGKRYVYIETNKRVKADWVTVHSATSLTAKTNFGNDIPANGFMLCALTNTTEIWLTNSGTQTATVQVAVLLV